MQYCHNYIIGIQIQTQSRDNSVRHKWKRTTHVQKHREKHTQTHVQWCFSTGKPALTKINSYNSLTIWNSWYDKFWCWWAGIKGATKPSLTIGQSPGSWFVCWVCDLPQT